MSRPAITLTTDFGLSDGYAGIMKGVILSICPEAVIVDISHEIHPHAVRQAAYVLSTAVPFFPTGTVHIVVVDPGVGSDRRAIAVQTEQATYVAPDNGVLSWVLSGASIQHTVHLTESQYWLPRVSATFHGRDIFAPAGAFLARGTDIGKMGLQVAADSLVRLPDLLPTRQADGSWIGEIIHIDRFGNLISNLRPASVDAQMSIIIGNQRIPHVSRTFAEAEHGELVAYVGSSGHIEIAERDGNAAIRLGIDAGAPVAGQVRS